MRMLARRDQMDLSDFLIDKSKIKRQKTLQPISEVLDSNRQVLRSVKEDLEAGLVAPERGREGVSAETVLRFVVLMGILRQSYRGLWEQIDDSIALRSFLGYGWARVPHHTAFVRAANRISPATMEKINQIVVKYASEHGLEDGRKIRMDTTVVDSNIHHPTDNSLLWDAVRALTRLIKKIFDIAPRLNHHYHANTKKAKRLSRRIASSHSLGAGTKRNYRRLIELTANLEVQADDIVKRGRRWWSSDQKKTNKLRKLVAKLGDYSALTRQIIDQATRRVLKGQRVPATEKVVSLFEPHTDIIKRGKPTQPVEFGHKIHLQEGKSGLITYYKVLDGNPPDITLLLPAVEIHIRQFGRAPQVVTADRGYHTREAVAAVQATGVRLVAVPRPGLRTPDEVLKERSTSFRRAYRFRAGIEGRISGLMRGRGLSRCRWRGDDRFETYVGAVILSHNLLTIAAHLRC